MGRRHGNTERYLVGAGVYLGRRKIAQLAPGDQYITHIMGDNERLDKTAKAFLNDSRLAWLIADINNIQRMWEVEAGDEVKVPTPDTAARLIAQQ